MIFFFFNDTATTEIYTLSLHDALPILGRLDLGAALLGEDLRDQGQLGLDGLARSDRKSTRLNSSHSQISYAVFCLKKKKKINTSINDPSHKLYNGVGKRIQIDSITDTD